MKRHPNCRFNIEEENDIINFYKTGVSISIIANKYNSSNGAVLNVLKANNIQRRTISESQIGHYYNNKEKFISKLIKKDNGCWEFPTSKNSDGYATTCYEGKRISAHRLAYILFNDDYDENLHVLHKCDNPSCCNPDHLFQGTHQDNMLDRNNKNRTKNRALMGEENPSSRFTEANITEIRSLYAGGETQREIGKKFNAHQSVISNIVLRKTWRHI